MYRQKAAEIKQKARRAQNPSAKRAFEEVARAWLLLAEQIAWMDSQKVYTPSEKMIKTPNRVSVIGALPPDYRHGYSGCKDSGKQQVIHRQSETTTKGGEH